MKKLSKKFMLSIVAIALVVIALGTSTFAWFTLSNKASLGQFNAEVTAGEGMELSVDGTTWYSNIPSTVIQAKIQENFNASPSGNLNNAYEPVLGAVTTNALSTSSFKKMDVANKKFVNATKNVDYISLEISVRAVGIDKISVDTIELTGQDTNWTADATFTHANEAEIIKGEVYKMSAKNAARVGIHSTTNNFVYQLPAAGGTDAPTVNSSNTIFEGTTVPEGTVPEGENPAYKDAMYTEATNGQEKYFVKKTDGIYMRGFTDYPELVIKAETDAALGVDVLTLTEVGDYYTGSFDLYVWFEGFDPDTYDAVLKMPLSVKLSLKGTPVVVVIP